MIFNRFTHPKNALRLAACLSLLLGLSTSRAQEGKQTYSEKRAPLELPLNNIRMTNRAQCALDSTTPTESVFMVIDGYNAGKLAYNLARNIGRDPVALSAQGMKEFRIAVTRLSTIIMNRLLSGSLPMLPLNLKHSKLQKYNSLVTACSKKAYCPELNDYLAKIWQNSEGAGIPWEQLDGFTRNHFFVAEKNDRVACYYVKKFSALQEHLHVTEVNQASLQDMAQAMVEKDKYLTNCENPDSTLDSRNAIIQLDLKVAGYQRFPSLGFDFWNSVKIYLSFAWRYTDVASLISPEMGELFKSVALEESLMMMPNGCRSIEKPECDSETLSMNSLRELAKRDGVRPDASKELPSGPDAGVIEKGPRAVNDDFLGTRSFKDASDWVENFRKNFIQVRGSLKNRAQSSIQFLNVVSSAMTAEDLADFVRPLAFAGTYSNAHRDELYYLCTETRLAGDQRIDFMKSGIDQIKNIAVMQRVFEGSQKSIADLTQYFDAAAAALLPLCEKLEQDKIWSVPNYQVNRMGFSPWARELLNIVPPAESKSAPIQEVQPISFGPPLLMWDSKQGVVAGNTICISAIDCARKITKSMVDLFALAKYAEAYLPVSSTVSTPDVFNPYAELNACKVYDPWFYTRRANKRLFADLINTALFGWNYVPIYVDIDFKAPKVTSLHQLIQDGIVKFDPKLERSKMEASLLADLGPLIGAPCAISISPNSAKKFNFYAFDGITLNYCNVKENGTAVGSPNGNVENSTPASRSYCGGCSINLIGVASGVAMAGGMSFNPIKLGIYLYRSISRFIGAKMDKVNVPRSQDVDLVKVTETFKSKGQIPKSCVDELTQGKDCK